MNLIFCKRMELTLKDLPIQMPFFKKYVNKDKTLETDRPKERLL